MRMSDYLLSLEQDPNWQATAQNKEGDIVVVMRGHPGAPYETGYYTEPISVRLPYTLDGIQKLFASKKLSLLRGSIPTEVNC
jgi:hypothetical protein